MQTIGDTNHGDISARHSGFHELFGARFRNGAKIINKVRLGHADTGIADRKDSILLVGGDSDIEILFGVELGGILQSLISDFVKGIRGVGNELSQEDFL